MTSKLIINTLLLFTLLFSQQMMAQGRVANRLIRGSNYQVAIGYEYQRVDLEDLNKSLTASDFPELSENIHSISFLTQNISNSWVATLKTSYSFTNEVELNRKEIEYRNQQYSLGLGYNVLSSERARLLPGIMATLSRNVLLVQDKASTSANFQSLLQNPAQEADLRNYSYLADVGLAYHYQFYKRERERVTGKSASWIPVIIKAGYQFELGSSDFKFDGDRIAGVPDISLRGFYASIHLGLGTRPLPAD